MQEKPGGFPTRRKAVIFMSVSIAVMSYDTSSTASVSPMPGWGVLLCGAYAPDLFNVICAGLLRSRRYRSLRLRSLDHGGDLLPFPFCNSNDPMRSIPHVVVADVLALTPPPPSDGDLATSPTVNRPGRSILDPCCEVAIPPANVAYAVCLRHSLSHP